MGKGQMHYVGCYTFAASYLPHTSTQAGAAADRAATLKHSKYQTISQTHIFIPVAIETSGVWNDEGLNFMIELGRRLTAITSDQRETTFLLQRISIAIQRSNSISFNGTFPKYTTE
jgi:hypothetical protein